MKKMQCYLPFCLAVIVMFTFAGCATSPPKIAGVEPPPWFLTPQRDDKYLFAVATATSKDLQLALNKAATDARAEIARQVEIRVQGLQKKFDEETGLGKDAQLLQMYTQATKLVISTSLTGSRIKDQQYAEEKEGIYRAFALVEYPIGIVNQNLMNQIKNREQLYTLFRASETFKEMEGDVQRYEEWKKQQGQ
jgi:hypothetical protein